MMFGESDILFEERCSRELLVWRSGRRVNIRRSEPQRPMMNRIATLHLQPTRDLSVYSSGQGLKK